MFAFDKYLDRFEQELIIPACAVLCRETMIPMRPGRLVKTRFASMMGKTFLASFPVVVDYYGYLKMSDEFIREFLKVMAACKGKQVRTISSKIVYFAAIKMEDVAKTAPELVSSFPIFKEIILKKRGFKK